LREERVRGDVLVAGDLHAGSDVDAAVWADPQHLAEYELTDKGKELGVVVGALAAWGARHVYKGARLVHADSGREVRLGYFRADTGERVPGSSIRLSRRLKAGSPRTPRRRG